jgi:hypothetical protein
LNQLAEFVLNKLVLIKQLLIYNNLSFLLLRNGQQVELVIQEQNIGRAGQAQNESLIKNRDHILKGISSEPLMNIHSHSVNLLQGLKLLNKNKNHSASSDGLDGLTQNVRG